MSIQRGAHIAAFLNGKIRGVALIIRIRRDRTFQRARRTRRQALVRCFGALGYTKYMILSRTARKVAAVLGICAIVFAQAAIAAHACAAFASEEGPASVMAAPAGHDNTPCGDMEAVAQKLCVNHCQAGQQSIDHYQPTPTVPVAIVIGRVVPDHRPEIVFRSTQAYSHALLARATVPPLAVRNCCFRI